MKKCKGCGAILQSKDQNAPGYTPKENSDYCQRCFRLIHYDDLMISMRKGIDPDVVMDRISQSDALILWVVDLFDFEAGIIPGLNRHLIGKDIIMVCTKRDILPDTLSEEKIARFVFSRLKENGISIKSLILTSKLERMGVEEVKQAVQLYRKNREVIVMGKANSGKSTLLNNLLGETYDSQRGKEQDHYRVCDPRRRHRLARSTDRRTHQPHQYPDQAYAAEPQGFPFQPRPAENGRTSQKPAQLPEKEGYRALPRDYRQAGSA